ncbi:hypothetical protein [Desulfoluna butyratoxydans]|uniref:Uncharacterized protein n=1 Tax=Desulfoluna butyratoxydans TaxID=231438 RepID=A0A4U8YJS0_9BACT|nr:hypothetical protein [Desulfoluna butyratoxydans]VFQ43901.1 hypothetical protein MSL71_15440 [Desulfoluna butyratoxydans]
MEYDKSTRTSQPLKQEPREAGPGFIRDLSETWAFLKDITREPTCAEELGWPEWRRWF